MSRFRTRRLLLTLFIVLSFRLLILNFTVNSHQALIATKTGDHEVSVMFETGATQGVVITEQFQKHSRRSNFDLPKRIEPNRRRMERKANLMDRQILNRNQSKTKLWFMREGEVRPQPSDANSKPLLWPEQDPGDRIVEQLMYIPPNYTLSWNVSAPTSVLAETKLKKILLYSHYSKWGNSPLGRTVFLRDKCPVNTCELTNSLKNAENADALVFKNRFLRKPIHKRRPNQVWILFLLESPFRTQAFKNLKDVFNWTATYRHDSDLVAPYEKFVLYNISSGYTHHKNGIIGDSTNYADNKTKKVAWFVSNCKANNKRLEYAKELGQHIEVDIYGSCGNKRCPRTVSRKCFRMLDKNYKFYLAFENANCKNYITEKFYINGLSLNVVPIVMGAPPEDYAKAAPPHSYIHVDDYASPKELANYLNILDKNDTLYNEYFKWKGTGEFVNTYFWCRVCAMLHAPPFYKSYPDMHRWWAGAGTCKAGHWRYRTPKKP